MTDYQVHKDPLAEIEVTLRNVISDVLEDKYGSSWIENPQMGLGKKWLSNLKNRQREEKGRRPTATVDPNLLSYCDFLDLRKLLEKHEDTFRAVFPEWDTLIFYLERAEDLRNPKAHNRLLEPHERALLEGIAGEIVYMVLSWRFGITRGHKRIHLQFRDSVHIEDRDSNQIFEDAERKGRGFLEPVRELLLKEGIEESHIQYEPLITPDYRGMLKWSGLEMTWEFGPSTEPNTTGPDGRPHRAIALDLWWATGTRIDLDDIIKHLNRPYSYIEFILYDCIDVPLLEERARDLANLHYASKSGGNVEYRFGTKYRIGAKSKAGKPNDGGSFYINCVEEGALLCEVHRLLDVRTIGSFFAGTITPRTLSSMLK